MVEEAVFFDSGDLKIEGLIDRAGGDRAVVVTHPHPLYGGEMHNNVVEAVTAAYRKGGYTTLRFNFRGVGRSGGAYGEGIGEQEDVQGALTLLREAAKTQIDLAGYSFGAWINALGTDRFEEVKRFVMVSPPVGLVDFSFLKYEPRIGLVIAGSHDDIGPPVLIRDMVQTWNPEARIEIIEGADHFYLGRTGEIEKIIGSFLGAAQKAE
jgi:alpha/beta superfamily hydrolase